MLHTIHRIYILKMVLDLKYSVLKPKSKRFQRRFLKFNIRIQ